MSLDFFSLPGFLGKASDWASFEWPQGSRLHPLELFSPHRSSTGFRALRPRSYSLPHWGQWVNECAAATPSRSRVLMGYSLGGRIALHALLQSPDLWRGAVIVSAHPGLQTLKEKELRLKSDRAWALRFEAEEWNAVLADWNAQSVFEGSQDLPQRLEADFDRRRLSAALVESSLGAQEDLRRPLSQLALPVLWVAGERASKFRALSEEMGSLNSHFETRILPGVGHRSLWDRPDCFESIKRWISKV